MSEAEIDKTESEQARGPALQCLGGQPPPFDVGFDLRELTTLPNGAKEHLWDGLAPSLAEPLPGGFEEMMEKFQRRHDAPGGKLARVLRACRFLIREACSRDLDVDAFTADLTALAGDQTAEISRLLVPVFKRARPQLRAEMVRGTLADHGRLLVGVDWRVDTLTASKRGDRLQVPVAFITLHLQEGAQPSRVTFQAVPETLAELRRACDRILK